MKHSKASTLLLLLILACTALLYSAYMDVKNRTIERLNSLQLTLAKQAAGSMKDFVEKLSAGLLSLSRIDQIVSLDESGKELMRIFHSLNTGDIAAITRTDPWGKIIYIFPPNPALLTLENHEHIKKIMKTHQPVLSEVFTTDIGSESIAYHVPVFENEVYKGSLGILIPFDLLARRHLEEIRIGEDGYGWAISRKGIELYCPVPGHVGRSVFENCRDFPEILRMAEEMVKGNAGVTTYVFDKIRGETTERVKKHAVYIPVRLGDTFWSLVVATPESDVIDSIQGFRNRWSLIAGILLITVALAAYYLVRASFVIREDNKRRLAEAALKDSEQLLQSIIQASPIPTFVIGRDHRVIHWNRAMEELTWIKAEEVIGTTEHWRAFYSNQRPCFADMVVDGTTEFLEELNAGRYNKSGLSEGAYESTNHLPDLGSGGKWLHFTVAAIIDSQGLPVGAIEIIEDITERKRSEEALEKAFSDLRELNFIVSKGPAVAFLWLASEGWPVEFVSDNIAQFGYMPDEFTSGTISYALIVHPEDLDRVAEEVMLHTRDGLAEFTQEYRIVCKSGEVRWIVDRTWVRRDKEERVTHFQGIVYDITERKRAEEALITANRELNDIIEFLPDGTMVIDKDRKIIAWNRAIEEMTGMAKKDMIGKPDSDFTVPFHGESRSCLLDLINGDDKDLESKYPSFERKGNTIQAETCVPYLYGAKGAFHLFATAAPLFDIHGNRVGAIESIRDITENKKKEEALLESQQQLADIINFLPDATLVIDEHGKVIAWNQAMEDMTGICAADMLGKGDFEYALPFYGERRPILIDLVLRPREEVEAEYSYVTRKDTVISGEAYMPARGGEAYLFGKASALFDPRGNIVGAIESIRDISERRRVEEALLLAEEKYRGIFENAMEGIYQSTLDGRFISINPAFALMLGYDSPEEALNAITDISRQLYVNPAHRVDLLRLLVEQSVALKYETQFFRKDGSIAWVTLNVRAVRDETGRIIYLEGTAEDISDRKALEAQLIQAQKMEAIGTLAGGIAHDFNNILSPIIGYSELGLQEIPPDTQLYRNMEQILRSGCRAKDLVKQILTFSRKTEQGRGPVQVSLLVKETLQMLRSTLPTTIEIRKNIDKEATYSTILANPTQIHQVLMNLCTNAAHAMRDNGGVLSISLIKAEFGAHSTAAIPGMKDGPYLSLSVSDTGHGMDEEVKHRIFDPYFTTKGPDEGTGLGLAVVYGIVKGLSGGIKVSSTPGEGTTFHLYFPIAETIETAPAAVPKHLPKGSGRVLVVDDEKSIGEMLKGMLEQLGYEVTLRFGSDDALGTFRAHPERFDLVITDQTMPRMTGTELAKEMLKIRHDIPIILCTGFSAMIDAERAREIGIRTFLMKPVVLSQLAEELNRLLNTSGQL